ncbi:CAP domain-containing protein [Roseiflexus sp.]|uniref:CAP domain-containing protein n=1 Tax=Roseiflexus sp. TaxID=2562120 RepID=UPI00398B8514
MNRHTLSLVALLICCATLVQLSRALAYAPVTLPAWNSVVSHESDASGDDMVVETGDPPMPDGLPAHTTADRAPMNAVPVDEGQLRVFLPLIVRPVGPLPTDWLGRVNGYRTRAGLPPVTENATLNNNCFEHARYMAENNDLTHNQDSSRPYASPGGQICAQKGNAWMGWGNSWQPANAIDGWMESVGHRLWLLYPTTPTFGFGFYSNSQLSAAALDVLSSAAFGNDASYPGWPVRYPAPDQQDIPATRYPITLHWPYFDVKPVVASTSLRVVTGNVLAHTSTTDLPANHKGIAITPTQALPPNATIEVTVTGSYKGQPFSFTWQFRTGN